MSYNTFPKVNGFSPRSLYPWGITDLDGLVILEGSTNFLEDLDTSYQAYQRSCNNAKGSNLLPTMTFLWDFVSSKVIALHKNFE